MSDSSSSSDEEEKAKLQSATWPGFSSINPSQAPRKGNAATTRTTTSTAASTSNDEKTQIKPSLRHSDDRGVHTDYRNVDVTTEQKAFIAKKLTSWLDSSISVGNEEKSPAQTLKSVQDSAERDFKLFSTSVPGVQVTEERPSLKRRQRPQASSSDSDSDEQRSRLASVAVSYQDVIQSSWPPTAKDKQVTPNLSPSVNLPTLTPGEPPVRQSSTDEDDDESGPRGTEPKCPLGGAVADDGQKTMKKKKRKKKKKKAKVVIPASADNEMAVTNLPQKESVIEQLTLAEEEGGIHSCQKTSPECTKKKKKKKKKKTKKKGEKQQLRDEEGSGKAEARVR